MVGNHLSGERFDLGQGGLFQRDMCAVVLEQALLGRFFDESIEGVRVAAASDFIARNLCGINGRSGAWQQQSQHMHL
ncbi:hypothetical protein [Pseudomonas moraviensis]|uniref:hypothetical protein n=1 Tax=Pseudomonas moraviensis TaxID=321662 RepID=UPI00080E64A7|nr:hypothetical protein [Pseudomonas moraviensis]